MTKKLQLFEYNTLSYFLIRATFSGICLNNLIYISKQDTPFSIIIAIILGFIPLTIYYIIINHNPDENITDLINKNGYLGKLINFFLIIFTFFLIAIVYWYLIDFISSQYLYRTPNLAISITFALALFYISNKSINVIARTSVILFYISIFLYLFSILGLSFEVNISNIKPIMEHGLIPILNGSFNFIAYSIVPLFLLTIIPKNMINNPKKLFKSNIIFYLLSTISLLIMSFILISTYGINFASILEYPEFHLLKRISLAGFIDRIENILSIAWILHIFIFITLGIYFIKTTYNNIFKKRKILPFIIVVLLVITTNFLFKNNTSSNKFTLNILPILIYLFYLIIPTLFLIKEKISYHLSNKHINSESYSHSNYDK